MSEDRPAQSSAPANEPSRRTGVSPATPSPSATPPSRSAGVPPAPSDCAVLTESQLLTGFRDLGLRPGMTIMAHSSLSAFGYVEGGAETVIRALLAAAGPDGTLALPTLCQKDKERRQETWDINTSPSDVGKITEVFRNWPGAVRSDHFTHSVTALGPRAEELTSGHAHAHGRPSPWGPRAFGHGSPWDKFYEWNVLYCVLGVTLRVNTMRHYTQCLLTERALQASGDRRAALEAEITGWNHPGVWPWWGGDLEEETLDAQGLIHHTLIGKATCRSIHARPLVDRILEAIEQEPEKWMGEEHYRWWRRARDCQG
ncbi:MAG: AAC(3) family N-acetyltransferase [Armatimonadia bacterium]